MLDGDGRVVAHGTESGQAPSEVDRNVRASGDVVELRIAGHQRMSVVRDSTKVRRG
jgi:hypothetical protein